LLLYDAIDAPEMRVCLLPLVSLMKLEFFFNSRIDGLDILYSGNVFGHATLKIGFLVLDLDNCYNINRVGKKLTRHDYQPETYTKLSGFGYRFSTHLIK